MHRQRWAEAVAARKRRRLDAPADNAAPRVALHDAGALSGVAGFLGLCVLARFVAAAPACNRAVLALRGTHVRATLLVGLERVRVGCGATARQVAHLALEYESDTYPMQHHDRFSADTLFGDTPHAQMPSASHALVLLDDATAHMTCLRTLVLRDTYAWHTLDLRVLPRCRHLESVDTETDLSSAIEHAQPLTELPNLRALRCSRVQPVAWNVLRAQSLAWTHLTLDEAHATLTLDGVAAALPHLTHLSVCLRFDIPARVYDDVVSLAPQLTSLTVKGSEALVHFLQHNLRAFAHLTALRLVERMLPESLSSDDLARALTHLPRLQHLHVESGVDSLAFLSSVPPTVHTVVLEGTRADTTAASMEALLSLTQVQHLTLTSAFARDMTPMERALFVLPLRARVLPALKTFTCT